MSGSDRSSKDEPVRRVYESRPSAPRDRDSFDSVARFRVLGWSFVGGFLGLLLGVFLYVQGQGGIGLLLVTTVVGWAASYFIPLIILAGAGRAGATLYAPSGASTPRKREYSLAETYAARGEYEMAVTAFEDAILEGPEDPVPYIRVARLQRDRLQDYEGAARWFKRGLAEAGMTPGQRLLTCRELVELYETKMGAPEKAAPLLARIAAERPDEPDGLFAAETLARIKSDMRRDGS
ncbi:MAG: hypothetical protein AAF389_17140 [Gemmatimonadota bacterium]